MRALKTKRTDETFPKGFWSRRGFPTQNALMMFFVYLTYVPKDWNLEKGINQYALEKVRQYFGVNYGIKCMLTWGIQFGCKNSKTSDERYKAMALAFHDAMGMIGQGYLFTNIKVNDTPVSKLRAA